MALEELTDEVVDLALALGEIHASLLDRLDHGLGSCLAPAPRARAAVGTVLET
jgi:hypothetical protein